MFPPVPLPLRCPGLSLQSFATLVLTRPLDCSLWYCAACSEGGELLCCDGCPAAFHTHCLAGQQPPAANSEWMCADCIRVSGW